MPKKTSSRGDAKIRKVMKEFKEGDLHSGPGGKRGTVKTSKQAVAIALSEARRAGKKIPRKK